MPRLIKQSWLIALCLTAMLAGCQDAVLTGPRNPLAVGAYSSLYFGDACGPSGKLPGPCLPRDLTAILDAHSDDPTIADVVLQKDHPRADLARAPYYVLGKQPGQATLVFKGMFTDGSVREDKLTVRVEAPDSFKLVPAGCYEPSSSTTVLVGVGSSEAFGLQMFAGSHQLVGWLPGAVTADGLKEQFTDQNENDYTWQAPADPVVLPLQSSIVTNIDGTLKAVGPQQITEIDLISEYPIYPFIQPVAFAVEAVTQVDGQPTCHFLRTELHSSTPSICSGPSGETVWLGDDAVGGHAFAQSEGSCALGVSVPGGPVLNTQTFPLFFVQASPAGFELADTGVACSVEGATACLYGDHSQVLLCQGGALVLKSSCDGGRVCDYVPDSTPGCVAGTACAQCRGMR